MVVLKSSKAIGSFLGVGTHVWLEVKDSQGVRHTFSGAKVYGKLRVFKDYKRDHDKPAHRGEILIPPPQGVSQSGWDTAVLQAGYQVIKEYDQRLKFSGPFPFLPSYGNCCTIVNAIVQTAGGAIPRKRIKGLAVGLGMGLGKKRVRKDVLIAKMTD